MTNHKDKNNGKDPFILETASYPIPVKPQTVQMGGTVMCIEERFPDKTVTFFMEFEFGLFFEGIKKYAIGIPVDEKDRFRPVIVVARPSPSNIVDKLDVGINVTIDGRIMYTQKFKDQYGEVYDCQCLMADSIIVTKRHEDGTLDIRKSLGLPELDDKQTK
jgi:hypothetical protein